MNRYGTQFEDTYPTAPDMLHSKHLDGPDPEQEMHDARFGFALIVITACAMLFGFYQLIKFIISFI